jgi:hypothetical protein
MLEAHATHVAERPRLAPEVLLARNTSTRKPERDCLRRDPYASRVIAKPTLTRTADEYLAGNPKIAGVIVKTQTFSGFASVGAFVDYARFIADHHARGGASHWSPIQPSRQSQSSWPATSSAWRCGITRLPRAARTGMAQVGRRAS